MARGLLDLIEGKSSFDLDFFETQVIQSDLNIEVEDVDDDIKIEVELYKNALESAKQAYSRFQKSSKPFFRPNDFFAEMIKSDSHMEKIRLRLIDENSRIKASEESKKKRELKKLGKAIQIENKLQREKESKRLKESVKELRKKRKDGNKLDEKKDEEEFEIELEEALSNSKKRDRPDSTRPKNERANKKPRSMRDNKFGHPKPKGVVGKRWKENTKESSKNFQGLGGKGDGRVSSGSKNRAGKVSGSRTGKPRLGKSKRQKR
ncbi:eukaryotic rRNA processing [Phakopsora pachyrhizi]|uniref:Eukaryotic rRNA processing n=1 Tax=Phakopsora pachyrhizi TaxID=170000 RepID=A0AAV0B4D1_PHAPC|nr:eukaryotic rRNA processing [Phakopsora pachyrhizi]CAH7679036.1 eukaryotic rRNA processing [Phakopsora pachyrhizi]